MGSVGNFLFGGSKQSSDQTSSSNQSSQNSSQNSSVQASQANSNQASANASGSANQAYGPLAASLMPSLGYVTSGGNMLGALLGLPTSTFNYSQPNAPNVMPAMPATSASSSRGASMIDKLFQKYLHSSTAPVSPSTPVSPPVPTPPTGGSVSSGGGGYTTTIPGMCVTLDTPILMADKTLKDAGDLQAGDVLYTMHEHTKVFGEYPVEANVIAHNQKLYKAVIDGKVLRGTAEHRVFIDGDWHHLKDLGEPDGHGSVSKLTVTDAHTYISNGIVSHNVKPIRSGIDTGQVEYRATGGPVRAGQPYVVGENQPEVFVPNQPGHILPSAPGMPPAPDRPGLGMLTPQPHPPHAPKQHGPGGIPPVGVPPVTPPVTTPPPPVNQYSGATPYNPAPASPTDAVNTFANSAGMNFILDQGQKALSGASAANGTFNSGATGKALTQYGQNLGSTYLNDYMNHLLDYAKLGLGGASALTGAGNVSQSVGSSSGSSNSSSFGNSSGSSTGSSIGSSYGTGSSDGDSKKGLVPDILG